MKEFFLKIFNSVIFIGYLKGGGTLVSILFLILIYYFLKTDTILIIFIFSSLLLTSVITIDYCKSFVGDDERIVIDELLGMMVSIIFLPNNFFVLIFSVLIFRYLDITKIFFLDRIERIYGSTGIILDDIFAGIFANLITSLILVLI